jgi:hypothetical protein
VIYIRVASELFSSGIWIQLYNEFDSSSFERRIEMSEQELKKSVEAMQNLRNDLTSSKEKALAFLVQAGIVTTSGELTKPYRQGA